MGHLRDLNVARGWAAVAVVAFHLSLAWPTMPALGPSWLVSGILHYGWAGVDLFFVLSGFVLAAPYLREGGFSRPAYWGFLGRRWLRIGPPHYAAMLLALILMGTWSDLWVAPRALPQHLFFMQNLTPDTLVLFNPVAWTLAIEFQFYLLLPLLLRFFQGRYWIPAALMLAAVSIVYRYATFAGSDGQWNAWAGLQIVPFLIHFGLGMAAARLWHAGPRFHKAGRASWAALAFGVALPLLLLVPFGDIAQTTDERLRYVIVRPLLALGFAGFVLLRAQHSVTGSPATRGLRGDFLGDISYSLYLVHVPLMIFLAGWLPTQIQESLILSSLVILAAVLVLATVFFYGVERPSRSLSRRIDVGAHPVPVLMRAPGPQPTPAPSPLPANESRDS